MINFIKKNKLIVLVILVGLFLRAYKPLTLFQYSHDQDLAGWAVRDVVVNHHFRLIGQETSSHGIFIGPYFYYLQIPFYLLTRMDPAGPLLLPILLGGFAIYSVYFVLTKIFERRVGLIGATIYAFSTLIVFTDREVVPTMPVVLWTIWYLYVLFLILKGKSYGYLVFGFLLGLIWSINLQLVILMPLILLAQIFSKKKIDIKKIVVGVFITLLLNIPFFAFELRHGFQQTKALLASLTTNKDYVTGTANGFLPKLDRTMQLVYKNSTNLFGLNNINVNTIITFWILIVALLFFLYKKKMRWNVGVIFLLWMVTYIVFFTKISLNISEYYLNGMNIIFILISAFGINELIKSKKLRVVGIIIAFGIICLNLYSFVTRPVNADGYVERKGIIAAIKEDSKIHDFPCVSLSFITSPGNNLGYRYFTWEEKLKTKPISNDVPVYTIVFPLSMVDRFDRSVGSLGLVLPDYKRYNLQTISRACEGDDYTLTQPMFGFTN